MQIPYIVKFYKTKLLSVYTEFEAGTLLWTGVGWLSI